MKSKFFGVFAFIVGVFSALFFNMSCVSDWRLSEGKYNVKKSSLPLHNLTYFNPKGNDAENFRRAEFGVKPFCMNSTDQSYGYYCLKYKRYLDDDWWWVPIYSFTLGTNFLLALFGVPSDSADARVYTTLYVFDSNGEHVMTIEEKGVKKQIASLWYGHKVNEDKVASRAFQKISDTLSTVGSDINRRLEAAGPVEKAKDAIAKEKISKFFDVGKKEVSYSASYSSSYDDTPSYSSSSSSSTDALESIKNSINDATKQMNDWGKGKCSSCNGTGVCSYCKGTGKSYGANCWSCKGTGKCSNCGGDGNWLQ